jgi:hypothetical protein
MPVYCECYVCGREADQIDTMTEGWVWLQLDEGPEEGVCPTCLVAAVKKAATTRSGRRTKAAKRKV